MKTTGEQSLVSTGIKKIVITLLTQVVILVLSLVTGFILPKKMGTEMFGGWQTYVFYLAYLNIFGLGLNDGFSLFYSGMDYKELPFEKIRASVRVQGIYVGILSVVLMAGVFLFASPQNRFIWIFIVLNISLTIIQCVVLSMYLAVNRTGIYNIINFALRVITTLFYLILIFANLTHYENIILGDFIARLIITIVCIIVGKEYIFGKISSLKDGLHEFYEKARPGISITISAIAITFIPVAGRAVIERWESKSEYGLYSFAVSIVHLIITFTSTAGMVIFPLLKKIDFNRLKEYYSKLIFSSTTLVYLALLAYIPATLIIKHIMVDYIEVLSYLHILLAITIPLSKIQLIVVPYYKASRLESTYLLINIVSLIAITLFCFGIHFILGNSISVALMTLVMTYIWATILDINLAKQIGGKIAIREYITEIVMISLFIVSASFDNLLVFGLVYGAGVSIYGAFNFRKIKEVASLVTKR